MNSSYGFQMLAFLVASWGRCQTSLGHPWTLCGDSHLCTPGGRSHLPCAPVVYFWAFCTL